MSKGVGQIWEKVKTSCNVIDPCRSRSIMTIYWFEDWTSLAWKISASDRKESLAMRQKAGRTKERATPTVIELICSGIEKKYHRMYSSFRDYTNIFQ